MTGTTKKTRQRELAILNAFWLWEDDIITMETMIKAMEKIKASHKKSK